MAKKSRRQPAKRKNNCGRRSGNAAHSAKASLASHQSAQELDSMVPALVRWHAEHAVVPDVSLVLKLLTAFFHTQAEVCGDATVSSIGPEDMDELVALLIERNADLAAVLCGSLLEFVDFLSEEGRWSGTTGSYQAVRRILCDGIFSARFLPDGWPGKPVVNIRDDSRNSA